MEQEGITGLFHCSVLTFYKQQQNKFAKLLVSVLIFESPSFFPISLESKKSLSLSSDRGSAGITKIPEVDEGGSSGGDDRSY